MLTYCFNSTKEKSRENFWHWDPFLPSVFRLTKRDDFFESILTTYESRIIFEAGGAVVKINSSLKRYNHNQI